MWTSTNKKIRSQWDVGTEKKTKKVVSREVLKQQKSIFLQMEEGQMTYSKKSVQIVPR